VTVNVPRDGPDGLVEQNLDARIGRSCEAGAAGEEPGGGGEAAGLKKLTSLQ
jgi:hypothetical protein